MGNPVNAALWPVEIYPRLHVTGIVRGSFGFLMENAHNDDNAIVPGK
jgi:hypothetical protein